MSAPRFRRVPGVVLRKVAGEPLLVRTAGVSVMPLSRGADLLLLNETGVLLWEVLNEPATLDDLARKLIEEYDVSEATARSDASAFVESMRQVGALTQVDEFKQ